MNKFRVAVGRAVEGGPYQVEWRSPEPIAFVVEKDHHDNNVISTIEVINGNWYVALREVHKCADYEAAERTLAALLDQRTSIFEDSPFDGDPVTPSDITNSEQF